MAKHPVILPDFLTPMYVAELVLIQDKTNILGRDRVNSYRGILITDHPIWQFNETSAGLLNDITRNQKVRKRCVCQHCQQNRQSSQRNCLHCGWEK